MNPLLAGLRRAGLWLFALLLVFEEWGWEPLQRGLAWIGRLPVFAWLERAIARLPPYAALALFGAPALALLPVKLGALWLMGRGHAVVGLAVIVAAKIVGTAVVARLFVLTRPALMRLAWFASAYGRWLPFKQRLLAEVRASWPWRMARVMKRAVRRRWQAVTRTASSR